MSARNPSKSGVVLAWHASDWWPPAAGDHRGLSGLRRRPRLRVVSALSFPEPAWLAAHCEPNVEDIVSMLSDEAQRLYRRYLADEARSPTRPAGPHPAWRAFDRMDLEIQRRNKARRAR